jgi:ABC-type Fe3+-hydroxamate transport system substrate-binding protein
MLLQLHAGPELVAVSSFDKPNLPPNLQNLPIAGDYLNINYETIVRLHPTAIVVQIADARLAPRLKQLATDSHIPLVNIRLDTLPDIFETARRLGEISGHQTDAARQIAQAQAELDEARRLTQNLPHPRTLLITWNDPISVVGSGGFLDAMITAAGGHNVGAEVGPDYPSINREVLVSLKPDIILITAPDQPAQQPDDPRLATWRSLPVPAAQSGRIALITDPKIQIGSLDVGRQTLALMRLIHPDVHPAATTPAAAPAATIPAPGDPNP